MQPSRSIQDLDRAPWTELLHTLPAGNHSLKACRRKTGAFARAIEGYSIRTLLD